MQKPARRGFLRAITPRVTTARSTQATRSTGSSTAGSTIWPCTRRRPSCKTSRPLSPPENSTHARRSRWQCGDIVITSIRIVNTVSGAVHDTHNAEYARFIREWLGPRARKLGWRTVAGDSEDTKAIRLAVVPLVAIGGEDAELGAEARRLAAAWLKDRSSVDRDSAGIILVAAARHSGRDFFEQLVSALRTTKDQYERYAIIAGLGAFRDPGIMRSALDLIMNPGDGIEPREVRSIISGQWRETRGTVWEYVRKNFEALNAKLPGARGIPYGATLPSAASAYCDASRASEVESFFKPRLTALPGGDRNLARVLEGIRLCEARKKVLEPGAVEFLEKRPR
ncbi:MAG TPA: ERAP1-like C-terminal domain-containing protein [Bryobacteraceae bacterium]|nr:ERAP1-like C-terminal domain-containing protein [Bryobacteraceae bacterium]